MVNEIAPQKVKKYILEKLSSFVRVNVLYFGDFGGDFRVNVQYFSDFGGIQCPILKLSSWALAPRAQLGHKPEPRVNVEALVSGPIKLLELKDPWASAQCARWVNTALHTESKPPL